MIKPNKNNDIILVGAIGRIIHKGAPPIIEHTKLFGGSFAMAKNVSTVCFSPTPTPDLTRADLKAATFSLLYGYGGKPKSAHLFNRSIVSFDFAKAEFSMATLASFNACKAVSHLNHVFYSMGANFGGTGMFTFLQRNNVSPKPIPTPNVRRPKPNDMSQPEIEIQEALGTLPFREYMKRRGILLENNWWYFPIPKTMTVKSSRTILIDKQDHYPVADGYIKDLYHSMDWHKWSEEKFAKEIIIQCYQCMGMEQIDI